MKPQDDKEIIEHFNKFVEKWCGNMAPHLLDNDDNDGEDFRDKLRALDKKNKIHEEAEARKVQELKKEFPTIEKNGKLIKWHGTDIRLIIDKIFGKEIVRENQDSGVENSLKEIWDNKYDDRWDSNGCGNVWEDESDKYFSESEGRWICPRRKCGETITKGEVDICPSCQDKNNSNTRQQELRKKDLGKTTEGDAEKQSNQRHIPAETKNQTRTLDGRNGQSLGKSSDSETIQEEICENCGQEQFWHERTESEKKKNKIPADNCKKFKPKSKEENGK